LNWLQIYHFCNSDGRQQTFHCGYGTVFNEYLGTCDHSKSVYCKGGEGFKPTTPDYKPPTAHHHTHHYHEPEPYHEPYHRPEPYHKPEPYHRPEPYHKPELFHGPSPFGFGDDEFRNAPEKEPPFAAGKIK
jgi:hypothetical protein